MIMNIPVIKSKVEFNELLDQTIFETKELKDKFPKILMYKNLYDQLLSLKSELHSHNALSKAYIYEKYTIGAIATKNFDFENEIYAQKLIRIFGTSLRYYELI